MNISSSASILARTWAMVHSRLGSPAPRRVAHPGSGTRPRSQTKEAKSRGWSTRGGPVAPWVLLVAFRFASAAAPVQPDPAPPASVEVRREARPSRPARTAPAEPRARTITTIAAVHTEGHPTLEGWMTGLDYADLADAIWSSTCPKPSL